jgi:hypothetical protein
VVGVLLPLGLFLAARIGKWKWTCLPQFFAGFCLIANGGYIGAGSFLGSGNASDPGVMLDHGSPTWLLWLFGVVAFPFGLWLWNGLEPWRGDGEPNRPGSRPAVAAS